MYKKIAQRGFTLIELLVVVLIIAVLAAIALPQYQKAVNRATYTQALAITKNIATAQKAYYLINGTYADTFDQLDIQIPFTQRTCPASKTDWMYTDCAKAGDITVALSKYQGDERGVRTGVCIRNSCPFNGYEYALTDICSYGNCKSGKLLSPGLYCREENTSTRSHCIGTVRANYLRLWYNMP